MYPCRVLEPGIDASRGHACGPRHVGSMPAEAMPPGHDMSNMPAETMPPGHDMSNMPGGMPGMPMPPGSTMPDMPGMPAGGHTTVKGLLPSQDGYTSKPENTDIGDGNFTFTITGPDGAPVKDYPLSTTASCTSAWRQQICSSTPTCIPCSTTTAGGSSRCLVISLQANTGLSPISIRRAHRLS